MTRLTRAASAALLGLAFFAPAYADTRNDQNLTGKPGVGYSLDLGENRGTGYYVETPQGYHLVLTLGAEGASPLRFETDLAAGQSVELSAPRGVNEPAQSIRITRDGDQLTIAPPVAPARFAAE
ncbi:hypothetical protein [Paracoccus aminophilus]|uniref:Uncharacterized protein n=1 Tax=Paracoccus aminophilus JCM 7686 TaxID=1367847 RepID=S5YGU3_PARAH|nr:hypothetical protein [Paracoccus aminophilus]AGT10688.1 hypothetical protein JCM7686_pAMI1p102 [Paracoccus aminophilus JCM 7686]